MTSLYPDVTSGRISPESSQLPYLVTVAPKPNLIDKGVSFKVKQFVNLNLQAIRTCEIKPASDCVFKGIFCSVKHLYISFL